MKKDLLLQQHLNIVPNNIITSTIANSVGNFSFSINLEIVKND